ncbi:ankyrin repeat-containing protein [Anaeramoeba flamelloides]|uniref:Ankyrin repeat-containing protein n=1 Tax=Anaeramoeba flamelloides TaxID=1746091 RepID=A0AAV8A6W6_9EUKA|nr:ankyrin repeat-containing protein [Anaeramoeba flamelloides]
MSKILKENNPDKIKEYLTKASDKEKNELLLLSIKRRKSLEIVKLILEGGANPNYEDKKHRSALQYLALINNDTEVLATLLDFGADPNCNYGGVSPIFLNLNGKKVDKNVIDVLLKNGADVNYHKHTGYTPFHLLCKQKNITMEEIKLFLKFNTDINLQSDDIQNQIYSPFRLILENSGKEDIIMFFLENGADPNDNASLFHAIKIDASLQIIKSMVDHGAEINTTLESGQTPPLHMCINNKEPNILKYLISKGVNINVKMFQRTLLEFLCYEGDKKKKFIEAILDTDVELDINAGRFSTPLMEYVKNDFDKKLFVKFLNKGAALENFYYRNTQGVLSYYCYNKNFKKENFQEIYELTKSSENIRSILKDALSVAIKKSPNSEMIEFVLSYFEENPLTEEEKFQILMESLYDVEFLENIKYMIETKNFPVEYDLESNRENALFVAMVGCERLDLVYYLLNCVTRFDKPVDMQYYEISNQEFLLQHHFLKLLFGYPHAYSFQFDSLGEKWQLTQYQLLKRGLEVGLDPNLQTPDDGFHALMFLGNIKYDVALKCAKLLIRYGANPFLTNKEGESFFTYPPINEKLHQGVKNYLSIVNDFQQLLHREENTDLEIKTVGNQTINVHSLILLNRLDNGLSVEQIIECFSNYKKNDLMNFLNWVYSGYASFEGKKEIQQNSLKIALELNFTEKQFNDKSYLRGLLFDLNKLFIDQNSKDFTILVPIEKEKVDEMEDEKEKEEEKEEQEEILKEIKAHKIILQARSELFRGLFSSISESENKVKDYTGKQFKTLEILIDFIYTNKIKKKMIEEEILMELDDVMEYYQLSKHSVFKEQRKKAKNYNRQLLQERLNKIINN